MTLHPPRCLNVSATPELVDETDRWKRLAMRQETHTHKNPLTTTNSPCTLQGDQGA